jgi:ABC-type sugar transport system ATPase subunit
MAVSANITLASLDQHTRFGALDFRRESSVAVDYTQRLGIKTPAIFAPVATLSGGNQQKSLVAPMAGNRSLRANSR